MLRWEKQKDGNYFAYSGVVVVGMVVKLHEPTADGKTHVWQLTKVYRIFGWKIRGNVMSHSAGKRSLTKAWNDWCEAVGLAPASKE